MPFLRRPSLMDRDPMPSPSLPISTSAIEEGEDGDEIEPPPPHERPQGEGQGRGEPIGLQALVPDCPPSVTPSQPSPAETETERRWRHPTSPSDSSPVNFGGGAVQSLVAQSLNLTRALDSTVSVAAQSDRSASTVTSTTTGTSVSVSSLGGGSVSNASVGMMGRSNMSLGSSESEESVGGGRSRAGSNPLATLAGRVKEKTKDAERDGERKHKFSLVNMIMHRRAPSSGEKDNTSSPTRSKATTLGSGTGSRSKVSLSDSESEDESSVGRSKSRRKKPPWKDSNAADFLPGVYSYPIQIQLPPNLPASIKTHHASITYFLKATVKRVGVLHPNLSSERELELVRPLGTDNLEELTGMGIKKFWETQMRFEMGVGAKASCIGANVPFVVRITPMAKIKLYRISATLEQRVQYYDMNHPDRDILKVDTSLFKLFDTSVNALRHDILFPIEELKGDYKAFNPLLEPLSRDRAGNEDVERVAQWYDPVGPWTVEGQMPIPDCSTANLQPSFRHSLANLSIHHFVKFTVRLERGDELYLDVNGKKRLFDLVLGAPIRILSCHCSTSRLPSYFTATTEHHHSHEPHQHQHSAKSSSRNKARVQTTFTEEVETHFSKLISGEVNEEGQEPPKYDQLVRAM
ncbi:hypothetical protein BT69DRAFT_354002 [Atractiella rhizophila]|nr:hypothetical protein BT69DRAFT_354002 [Atractiella rhizophila]